VSVGETYEVAVGAMVVHVVWRSGANVLWWISRVMAPNTREWHVPQPLQWAHGCMITQLVI
jgi:hypothetical protein